MSEDAVTAPTKGQPYPSFTSSFFDLVVAVYCNGFSPLRQVSSISLGFLVIHASMHPQLLALEI